MTRETRIAMVVGLLFIVLFGLVLSELAGTPPAPAAAVTQDRRYVFTPPPGPQEADIPVAADRPRAEPGRGARPRVESSPLGPRAADAARRGGQVRASLSGRPGGPPLAAIRGRPAGRQSSRPPSAPAQRIYTVRANDTLIGIARKVYGAQNWRQYRRIFAANRDRLRDEATLNVGQKLVIPALPGRSRPAAAGAPAAGPARRAAPSDPREVTLAELRGRLGVRAARPSRRERVYVVRRGDCLTKIARRMLDDGTRRGVMRIYEANRDRLRSPDELPVGVELRIPGRS